MPKVYVEARAKVATGEDPVDDYVVEDHADRVLIGSESDMLTALNGAGGANMPITVPERSGVRAGTNQVPGHGL
jgi:hypothetical protein